MTAALGGDEGVDFIEDDGFDGAQGFASVGSEQEVDGFRGGDEDIGGVAGEAGAFGGGGVAGADGDGGLVEGDARGAGGLGDADERGAEVAFDIDGEGLDGGDIEDAAALVARRDGGEHEAVDAPQKGGEGFAGAGGGEDEGGFAAGDGGPAELLGPGGSGEDGVEPGADGRVEEGEGGFRGHGSPSIASQAGEAVTKRAVILTRRRGDTEIGARRKTVEGQHLRARRKRRNVGWRHRWGGFSRHASPGTTVARRGRGARC